MAVTLITGATGFIGSHVCRLLVERGDEVVATVRPGSSVDELVHLGVRTRFADIRDRRSIRRAMRDVERVFHLAGSTDLAAPRAATFAVHVEGTRIVLEEALRASVERVVLTSSVAAIGPAPGDTVADERNLWDAGRHAAERQAADGRRAGAGPHRGPAAAERAPEAGRGTGGVAAVGVHQPPGQARAGLEHLAARGLPGGDDRLVSRARR
ncbi:MAG: NAD-dependent epimerase/dehydratase family protein [Actinobacteria bacterium]|nr:NAD-dependent epimerase/dehydratase family protein [Actinomycetota bacterium]